MESMTARQGMTIALQELLTQQGFPAKHVGAACEIIWEALSRASGYVWLENVAMSHLLREAQAFATPRKYGILGGFSALVDAFVERVVKMDGKIVYSARATSVKHNDKGTSVNYIDKFGRNKALRDLDCVICAIPASAITHLEFVPRLHYKKKYAFSAVNYLSASKSAILYRSSPFKEARFEDGIFWQTDLLIQQSYIPPRQAFAKNGPVRSFIASYMWGENARRFAALSQATRDDLILRGLSYIDKGLAKESNIEDIVHQCWDEHDVPGGGAFAFFQPGQHKRYQKDMMEPHRDDVDKRREIVFFAGEHAGLIQGWIQAAMQTALTATLQACEAAASRP
jgi:monoamine oxidase